MKSLSLRRTLLLRCGLGVGVLLCLLSTGIYLIVRHGLFRELERSITQTASLLSNQVELENGGITFEWKEGVGTNQALHDNGLFQFWNESTGSATRSSQLKGKDLPKFCGPDGKPLLQIIQLPGTDREALAIGMRIYPFVLPPEALRMKETGRIIDPRSLPHILVVARGVKSVYRVLNRTGLVLGVGTLLTLGLVFLLIRQAILVTLRPIDELTLQMKDRAEHQLDFALHLPGTLPVELTGLAENFDSLLARVAAIRQRERDFIRHAAHELRTPIAGLQATAELALSQNRDATSYATYLETCRASSAELGELVKRLTALARIGQSGTSLKMEDLDARKLLEECLPRLQAVFSIRAVPLDISLAESLFFTGDSTLAHLILNNLLDNAACYSLPGSTVRIGGKVINGQVEIQISNQTRDLPENPNRLFEPLFRKEPSRSDADRHLGIGLTLSMEAANAMGATLTAQVTAEDRLEFTLRLPLGS